MICVSVLYPNTPGSRFDHDYYASSHMPMVLVPMVLDRLKDTGMVRYEIDRGLAGGAPGSPALYACIGRLYFRRLEDFQRSLASHGPGILADVPNYTDIEMQLQISETDAAA